MTMIDDIYKILCKLNLHDWEHKDLRHIDRCNRCNKLFCHDDFGNIYPIEKEIK
jgi:hypothetical protein